MIDIFIMNITQSNLLKENYAIGKQFCLKRVSMNIYILGYTT